VTRLAVIGLGVMGRNHARVLSEMEGVELRAVCDQDAEAVESVSSKYGVKGFASWRDMMEAEELDAAIIAVPTRGHLEVAQGVLAHGLHVLVEKPIATNLAEGWTLVEAARTSGRLLAVGHVERFNPAVRELQRRMEAGEIGRVFQIHARRQGPFPVRIRDVGVVIDLATHDLDVMRTVLGCEVDRLHAETEQRIHTEHEDMLNALLRFENGVVAVLQVNWLTPTKIREFSVLGEGGLLHVDYLTQELTQYKNAEAVAMDGGRQLEGVSEGEVIHHPIAKGEPLKLELQSFVMAVRGEAKLEVDGDDGLRALHLAQALVASAQEGRMMDHKELEALWTTSTHARD
jgi:UDP-N-acetylglucosamine 3-dehydrogenase